VFFVCCLLPVEYRYCFWYFDDSDMTGPIALLFIDDGDCLLSMTCMIPVPVLEPTIWLPFYSDDVIRRLTTFIPIPIVCWWSSADTAFILLLMIPLFVTDYSTVTSIVAVTTTTFVVRFGRNTATVFDAVRQKFWLPCYSCRAVLPIRLFRYCSPVTNSQWYYDIGVMTF